MKAHVDSHVNSGEQFIGGMNNGWFGIVRFMSQPKPGGKAGLHTGKATGVLAGFLKRTWCRDFLPQVIQILRR